MSQQSLPNLYTAGVSCEVIRQEELSPSQGNLWVVGEWQQLIDFMGHLHPTIDKLADKSADKSVC